MMASERRHFSARREHNPENVGETTAQAILVEFKGPATKK